MDEASQDKITQAEMIEMFGEAMPIEAVNLVFDSPDGMSIGEMRAELRRIAKAKSSTLLQSVREAFALMAEHEDPPGLKSAVMFRKGDLDDSPEIVCGMIGARAGVEALEAALVACEAERDEAVDWSHIVDRHGTDNFDALADAWLERESVAYLHNAIGSVFTKWANDDIMERFKESMRDTVHLAFVEGCLVGVRAEIARTALGADGPSASRAAGDGGEEL